MKLSKILNNKQLQTEFIEGFDLDKFLKMKSFAEKIRYANSKLKKIASGSARIIYEIDNKTVLKLAKNKKGIAQNEVEADYFINNNYGGIICKAIEYDEKDRWIISERSKKITPTEFRNKLGISPEDLWKYLKYRIEGQDPYIDEKKIKNIENSLDEKQMEFIEEMLDMIVNMDMEIVDFRRISSYGKIDSSDKIIGLVINDYGLTKSVFDEFYRI